MIPPPYKLHNKAFGFASLRRGEALGKRGDYIAGIRELEASLKALPGNTEAEQLLADFNLRKPEQIERMKAARTNEVRVAFDALLPLYRREAALFERHEVKSSKAAMEAQKSIEDGLWNLQPHFFVPSHHPSTANTFAFETMQEVPDGLRRCLIAGGQIGEGETLILYEVLEYKNHRKISVDGNLRVTTTLERIPAHPSRIPDMTDKLKAQVEEGQRIVSECLQRAAQ